MNAIKILEFLDKLSNLCNEYKLDIKYSNDSFYINELINNTVQYYYDHTLISQRNICKMYYYQNEGLKVTHADKALNKNQVKTLYNENKLTQKDFDSFGINISNSESFEFGDKDFTITWPGKLPKDSLLHVGITRTSKGISYYFNGYKIPWWAKGFLLKLWQKRVNKKLLKSDVVGE